MANPKRFLFFAMLTVNAFPPAVIGGAAWRFFSLINRVIYIDVSI